MRKFRDKNRQYFSTKLIIYLSVRSACSFLLGRLYICMIFFNKFQRATFGRLLHPAPESSIEFMILTMVIFTGLLSTFEGVMVYFFLMCQQIKDPLLPFLFLEGPIFIARPSCIWYYSLWVASSNPNFQFFAFYFLFCQNFSCTVCYTCHFTSHPLGQLWDDSCGPSLKRYDAMQSINFDGKARRNGMTAMCERIGDASYNLDLPYSPLQRLRSFG